MEKPTVIETNDPHKLRAIIAKMAAEHEQYQAQIAARDQKINLLLERLELLRHQRFGPKADRVCKDQLKLFDEAELNDLIEQLDRQIEDAKAPIRPDRRSSDNPPKRRALPSHLPRVERIIDLPEAHKVAIAQTHVPMGFEESEQLAVLPRQYYVVKTKRAKYAPIRRSNADQPLTVVVAPRPASILPKAIGHSSLIADVVTGKFVDGLPLYRQEKIFAREGFELSRQTMSGWMVQLREPLQPLMAALKQHLYRGPVLQIDETPVQVMDEPGRDNTSKSQMWVYRGGPPDQPVIWFEYSTGRAAAVPREFLFPDGQSPPGASFYLQSDGYAVYHQLAGHDAILGHMGCWAHVRRKVVEAANSRHQTGLAHEFLGQIQKLYQVDRKLRGESPERRKEVRQTESRPILDELKAWLDKQAQRIIPKGLLGKAIGYTRNQWPTLMTFLEDGHLEIDNNLAENAIRPFVVGRKAWLFSGSPAGAEASAMLYTLIETAKANGLEPRAYLHYLFEALPNTRQPEGIEALLPQHLTPEMLKIPKPAL
jgi:transposase